MYKALTIAGSDCSGGAGIQADLKTFAAHGVYGMSVITAITAQNTLGVYGVQEIAPDMVAAQLDAVFKDIRPDAVKIGMVASEEIIEVIAERLTHYAADLIVLDPVMVSTSGCSLMNKGAETALIKGLIPLATLITPNLSEMEILVQSKISNREEMEAAAQLLSQQYNGGILVKGGHLLGAADDLLYIDHQAHWFSEERVDTKNTHGTGCTLSSAIAAGLAKGLAVNEAVKQGKAYVYGAICDGLDLGSGNGPLNHLYQLK